MLTPNPKKPKIPLFLSVLAVAPFTGSLYGQDQADAIPDDEVIELNPFIVETSNTGYLETNAVSGTSLNMSIRDIAMSLEVINNEFIVDQQATDLKEALAYSAGVFTQSFSNGTGANEQSSAERSPSSVASVNSPFTNTVSIRGFAVPTQQRFGFRIGGVAVGEGFSAVLGGLTDTVNTERLEVVRGPAALLYGVNVLSGVVNIMPKRPLGEFAGNAAVSIGSDGFKRAQLDITGRVIKDRINYRLMTAQEERDHYTAFRSEEKQYYAGQLEFLFGKKLQILVEAQYGDYHRNGVDSSFFTDTLVGGVIADNTVNTIDFRNEFDERIQYGREDYSFLFDRDESDPNDIFYLTKSALYGDDPYPLPVVGEDYRVSGPDTYFDRKEYNLMGLITMQPIDNLNIELGAYYTHAEEENFGVEMGVFTNTERDIPGNPTDSLPFPAFFRTNPGRAELWPRQPEVYNLLGGYPFGVSGSVYGLDQAVGFSVTESDIPNLAGGFTSLTSAGLGEVFVVPDRRRRAQDRAQPTPEGLDYNTWNTKFARYFWMNRPLNSESLQMRARAAYSFETGLPFLGDNAVKHTLIGGFQYSKDELEIVSGTPPVEDVMTSGPLTPLPELVDVSLGWFDRDAYILRQSVFDMTPIRYNGERTVIPGGLRVNAPRVGLPLTDYVEGPGAPEPGEIPGWNIALSGWRDVEVEQRGFYGIYQAQFFNDKATFYTGLRNDSYQVEEVEYLRALAGLPSRVPERNNAVGEDYAGLNSFTTLPYLVGDGSQPYTQDRWITELPDVLNLEIQREIDLLREGIGEQGTRQKLFDEPQSYTTASAGLSFRISEPLSIYMMYSEGVFPNQGQRDGLDNPIDAEQTSNKEIGIKFDFFDSKISGTISFYEITRENATWQFNAAPSPRQWVGGANGPSALRTFEDGEFADFDAQSALTGDGPEARFTFEDPNSNVTPETYQRYSYGIHESFFREAYFEVYGTELPSSLNQNLVRNLGFDFVASTDQSVGGRFENVGLVVPYFYVDVSRDFEPGKHLDDQGNDLGLLVKNAFDKALVAKDFDGRPIDWSNPRASFLGAGNNPSNNTGDLVTFSDQTVGMDGQVFLRMTENYQVIFSFSYQKREIIGNGFNLAPLIDPITGQKVPGTKYDQWVFILGEENFTDPTDPSTFTGGGINGLDLSFVPEYNGSIWNKYEFSEGRLKGASVGFGIRYFGEAPTSVPIGGTSLSENEFPTPPTKDRISLDASLSYKWTMWDTRWQLALKVNNLLDERRVENQIVYPNTVDGIDDPQVRRSVINIAPRNYRLSLSARF